MKVYCTKCGGATAYTSVKPKFCSSCGHAFEKAVASKQQPKTTRTLPQEEFEDDDYIDEDPNFVLENLASLDVEFIEGPNERGVKLGEVLGMDAGQTVEDLNREPDPIAGASKEQILKQLKSEAGTANSPARPKKKTQRNRNNGKSKT